MIAQQITQKTQRGQDRDQSSESKMNSAAKR
jgi:hypothetical protein